MSDSIDILVPEFGHGLTEALVIEWLVSVGDAVERGDVIAVLETDKSSVDLLAEKWSAGGFRKKFEGQLAQAGGHHLLKPQTYMNLSGRSVGKAAAFFQLGAKDIVVGSYVNFSAVLTVLRNALRGGTDVAIVCAGQDRQFSLEDAACAGLFIQHITAKHTKTEVEFRAWLAATTTESGKAKPSASGKRAS